MTPGGAFVQVAWRAHRGPAQFRSKDDAGPPHAARLPVARSSRAEVHMNDLIFVAITTAFFACAWAYVHACDRLE